jgi:hypothetical protein
VTKAGEEKLHELATRARALLDAMDLQYGDPVFSLNVERTAKRLRELLPKQRDLQGQKSQERMTTCSLAARRVDGMTVPSNTTVRYESEHPQSRERRLDLDDALQMTDAPSSDFSAGEWCEAAGVLALALTDLLTHEQPRNSEHEPDADTD